MTKSGVWLRGSLLVQIGLCVSGWLIVAVTANSNDFSGLIAVLPLLGFGLLFYVNVVLGIMYVQDARKAKARLSWQIGALFIVMIALAAIDHHFGFLGAPPV